MIMPPHGGDGIIGEFFGEDLINDNTAPTGFPLRHGRRAASKHELTQQRTVARVELHLDAWVAAALHLHAVGTPPLVPLAVSRALWRRGDRELASELARLQGAGA